MDGLFIVSCAVVLVATVVVLSKKKKTPTLPVLGAGGADGRTGDDTIVTKPSDNVM